ncbi:FAD-binding protein [Nonomuraea angiospora]|uniref:FAD-binding oxidoreductase n=1 Tax=Nonomuraea angiospora TaxID=46172 RepID=UPI0033271FD9
MSATLQRDLAARVDGEVRFDAGSRAAYAHDASNYRQVPIGVVIPRTIDAAVEAVAVCRRLVRVDPERRRAVVEPGACLDDLNAELSGYHLMVGPKPATHDTCTIGGMIGNNSCGASAQAYGPLPAHPPARLRLQPHAPTACWRTSTAPSTIPASPISRSCCSRLRRGPLAGPARGPLTWHERRTVSGAGAAGVRAPRRR